MAQYNNYYYRAFGLTITSEFEIPELLPCPAGEADVNIRLGDVPESLDTPKKKGVRYQAKPGVFLLKASKVADYLVSNGSDIIVSANPAARNIGVRLFLLGSAFGALLHQRGMLLLHASAIRVDDKCVIFCGESGSGKSTLARTFIGRGYRLHTDDICAISVNSADSPVAFPGYPRLKLWEDTLKNAGEDPSQFTRLRRRTRKYAVPAQEHFNPQALPIKKIYALSAYNRDKIEMSEVRGVQRFRALMDQTYRQSFVKGFGNERTHFELVSRVCGDIPILRVRRPIRPFLLRELADGLEADFLA